MTHLSAPLDDNGNLLANTLGVESGLELRLRAVRGFLLLDNLFELLKTLTIASREMESFVGSIGDVLKLIGVTEDDLVCSTLEKSDERLSPRVRSFEVELEFA